MNGLNITGMRNLNGKLMLIQFTECTVTYKDEVLFSPDMGEFDMALGQEILSAFAGAADYLSFKLEEHVISSTTIKHTISETEKNLLSRYQEVRDMRENETVSEKGLLEIFKDIRKNHPNDWLLSLEIFELTKNNEIRQYLEQLTSQRPEVAHLIANGIELTPLP